VPWNGGSEPGAFPTLGYQVAQWIESYCAIPDGDHAGDPFRLTDEQYRFLLWYYRLVPETGRFFFDRGGQLIRPQKWGKGPFSGAMICAEAAGPVLFDGWNADGDPVGRSWKTPWIQVTAISEGQTDNVWRALVPMITLGFLIADIPDTGDTRINLPGGGKIEPVTSSARSRLGQRLTFAVQDQTESWTKQNGGRKVADTQRRNLAGMSGRWLETGNAWDPGEESVAQQTRESEATGVHFDDVEPGIGSIRNKRERRKMLRKVYGDSALDRGGWVDLERIEAEIIELLQRDPSQAERYFLNRKEAAEDAAFDADRWASLANSTSVVADQALVTIGVDGARFRDALAIVATEVQTGFQWPLGIWERPELAGDDYEHPMDEVDIVMLAAMERFDVWRVYCDPQWIEALIDRWAGRWGEKIVNWFTNRPKPMAFALRAYKTAQIAGELSHDGDAQFARHIANARRKNISVVDDEGKPMWIIGKNYPMSPLKIDAAMAGCLSWEARGDAIAAGAPAKEKRTGVVW
jgi:hypothetical protein